MLPLANMVEITQHTVGGSPVSGELAIDLTTSEIYYDATVRMDQNVASLLAGQPYLSNDFAQFQIKVSLDDKLDLAGVDGNGMVEFTLTCPFLRPVSGSEVLVNGEAVKGLLLVPIKAPMFIRFLPLR